MISLEEALQPIQQPLEAVTRRMLEALHDPVARMAVYLITAGGKRLRPALVLLAGRAGHPSARPDGLAQDSAPRDVPVELQDRLIDAAAAVELIHTATLIHDDIIDESPIRRRQPTFHARWGVERAVLMGDYLYATAFTVLSRLQHPEVTQVISDVCQQLSRGELREVEARYRWDVSEPEYLQIIRDKTASLIGGSCRCGALLGGLPDEVVERFTTFGINMGLAFQIADDCLDLTGDQQELGKSIHADLDKGILSLPMIYLSRTLSPRKRQSLFGPLRRARASVSARSRVAKAAIASGAVEQAHTRARAFTQEAQGAMAGLSLNGLSEAYAQLAEYTVSRRR